MAPRVWPEHPDFVDASEQVVWEALIAQLRDVDVMLHGLRFTDPVDGEVEIDILVLMPDMGAAVVEVKGGHITYSGGRVRQNGADGVHNIDPAGQSAREVRALQRFLERQPTWSRGRLRAGWLVALPYTAVGADLGPELPREVLIGKNDLADAAGRVFDRLGQPGLHTALPPGDWIQSALDHLLGVLDEGGEIAGRTSRRLERVEQLTEQQAALLSVVRNVRRIEVTGAAGTGKTWLAIEQARRWSAAGERVCFVSYTRGAIESVRRAMADLPDGEHPAYLGTFFQLGYEWGVHVQGPDDRDFWNRRGAEEIRAKAEELPDAARFTALVVDEAQDFSDAWWPALLASCAPDVRIAVFRDDEQAVFAERRGRPDVDLVPLVLDENLRNARQIVDAFRPLISADVTSRAGDGFPVEFVACGPGDDVVGCADDAVADLLERRGWLPEHVALLTSFHRHPVQRELDGDKAAYWDGLWQADDVFYSTVAGFKGLERPAVVLCVDGFHDGLEPRNVMYSGMSRARDLLVVVATPGAIEATGDKRLLKRLLRSSCRSPVLRGR